MSEILEKILIAAFGILAGALVQSRFQVLRDRRVEFNEIADELFLQTDVKLTEVSAGYQPDPRLVKQLRRQMNFSQRSSFDKAVQRLRNAVSQTRQDAVGQRFLIKVDEANAALADIRKCLKRR